MHARWLGRRQLSATVHMNKPSPKSKRMTLEEQHAAFVAMAAEVGADERLGALERSFGQINPKAAKPAAPKKRPRKAK